MLTVIMQGDKQKLGLLEASTPAVDHEKEVTIHQTLLVGWSLHGIGKPPQGQDKAP